jgi:4-amino-4-deoxy-L-arabinose transferase-like glycosyltransferase
MIETAKTIESHRPMLAAIGLIVVIGAVLRLHNLSAESLWYDEAVSWTQSKDSLLDLIVRTAHDNYPPLHNLVLFASIKLLGDNEWSLRLPSAIFGVLNVVALYWLGTMTVGRIAGLMGAVLLAFSPFHLYYSQEGRMYSLLALTATLYAATCYHYVRAPSLLSGACVSLAGIALVYSHPYGTLDWIAVTAAFAVFVLRCTCLPPRAMRIWKVSNVVVVMGFLPLALALAYRTHTIESRGFWISPLSVAGVWTTLGTVAGGRLFAGVIFIGVVLGIAGWPRRDVAVLCVWIVAPIAIGILASILSTPIFFDRYLIGSLPPFLLLSAFGWTKYMKEWRVAMLSTAVVAIASLTLLRYQNPYYEKDDLRSAAAFLNDREQPTDCVFVVPGYKAVVLDYYRRNSSCEMAVTKPADLPAKIPASALFGIFDTPDSPNSAAIVDELRRQGWRDLDRTDFRGASAWASGFWGDSQRGHLQVVTFSH